MYKAKPSQSAGVTKVKVTAAVYKQCAPEVIKPVRHFFGEDGRRYLEHRANMEHITDVSGTYDECWTQAKALTLHPVLEFPRGMYRGGVDRE